MKRYFSLITVMILILAGCTSEGDDSAIKVGFVTDTGGINDRSFNQGTWEGIEAFTTENGLNASYTETAEESQIKTNLSASAMQNDIVIAAGYSAADPMYHVAKANPDTDFILIDAEPQDAAADAPEALDNVHSFLFREEQAGYLVGYIAGKQTKTDVVGYIGGIKNPAVERFGLGFIQGVQDANDQAKVLYNYTGTFDNAEIGKTTATTMYSQNADIIFAAAGGVNAGVVEAAKEQVQKGEEAWVIGVDRDCYEDGIYAEGKSVILTSAVKQVGEAAKAGLKLYNSGEFKGGSETLGYAENGVGLPTENPNLDEKVVEDAKSALEKADVAATKEDTEKKLTINVNGNL